MLHYTHTDRNRTQNIWPHKYFMYITFELPRKEKHYFQTVFRTPLCYRCCRSNRIGAEAWCSRQHPLGCLRSCYECLGLNPNSCPNLSSVADFCQPHMGHLERIPNAQRGIPPGPGHCGSLESKPVVGRSLSASQKIKYNDTNIIKVK